ncbi:putative Late nodulin [Medicago truncatula]|uniref:Nodule Cysteine-Rich (NCR) secreted peptide n=1 Tax=Medicago truncatula TaxID=3880 RepID=A0A072TWJ1_MEDTR|nr:Nodule Cysteine-Rich (NCR) secreted peptide [Medicago truncatula]RHN44108.1 putative Late nodulin [Medicago truncatula]
MTKILNFVYAMIIILSLFLLVTNIRALNCTTASQCVNNRCYLHGKPSCLNGQCACV